MNNNTPWSHPVRVALLCSCLGLAALRAEPAQTLANGSFESLMLNGLPEEWDLFCPQPDDPPALNRGSLANFAITDSARDGRLSLRLSATKPVRCALLQRGIPVAPADKWILSLWMKGQGLAGLTPERPAFARVAFINTTDRAKNRRLASFARTIGMDEPDFDWKQLKISGEVPADADAMQVELFLWKSTGTVWFDDISLIIDPAPGHPPRPRLDRAGRFRYRSENLALSLRPRVSPRVIFLGDSITENWNLKESFDSPGYINRGIGGQSTWQMIARLQQDVLAHKPDAVALLAGTNDIAGATPNDVILANLRAIMHACQAADIPVVVSSLLPVSDYNAGKERTDKRPPATILALNAELRALCAAEGARYVDLHKLIADEQGLLPARYSADGLHPNAGGYAIFSPVVQAALNEVLSAKH